MKSITSKLIVGFLLFIVQASCLGSFYTAEVAPFAPRFYDQATYLADSYRLSWEAQNSGLQVIAAAPFRGVSPQGALFITEGALLDLFAGGGRGAELLLNFAGLFLAEFALYSCVASLTGQPGLGLSAVGLFLLQHSLWNPGGGIFDFRIDYIALCLYGIAICLVLRARVFLSWRWTIASALCMAMLILNRFITATYLFGLLAAMIAVLLALGLRKAPGNAPLRARHAILCAVCIAALTAPIIFMSRHAIHDYYVVGHVTGPERAIRVQETGLVSWAAALTYYPLSVVKDHLGMPFGIGVLVLLLGMLAAVLRPRVGTDSPRDDMLIEVMLVAAAIVAPLLVLDLDATKSPIVGGIVCIPVVLLIALLPRWLGLSGPRRGSPSVWLATGVIIAGLGVAAQFNNATIGRLTSARAGFQHWSDGVTWLFNDARARNLQAPRLFFDTNSQLLNSAVVTAFGYERTRSYIRFGASNGDQIFAVDPATAMAALPNSDYALLSNDDQPGYPFTESMAKIAPQVRAWAQDHMVHRRRFDIDGNVVDIYSKPMVELEGVSGQWIRANGAFVRLVPSEIKPGQLIVMQGWDAFGKYIETTPVLSAIALVPGSAPVSVPAIFKRGGGGYEIDIDPAPLRVFGNRTVDVDLSFDRFFIPKDVGINTDPRHLVVMAPVRVNLVP